MVRRCRGDNFRAGGGRVVEADEEVVDVVVGNLIAEAVDPRLFLVVVGGEMGKPISSVSSFLCAPPPPPPNPVVLLFDAVLAVAEKRRSEASYALLRFASPTMWNAPAIASILSSTALRSSLVNPLPPPP